MCKQALFKNIEHFIERHNLINTGDHIIIGLSGGPDSIFLLHFLHHLQQSLSLTLTAAHLNHEWRLDADRDVAFCQELTQKLGILLIVGKAQEHAHEVKKTRSKEEHGRLLRRHFFAKVKKNMNATSIALAHHAQDQQETFFIRLIRGTTLSGLCAMKPKNNSYIRPLLETNKSDIISFLDTQTIAYLTDPTNISLSFLRNRIRLHVLPALQTCDTRFNQNFLRTLDNLQEHDAYLHQQTTEIFATLSIVRDQTQWIDIKKLQQCVPLMQNRIVMHWLTSQQVPFTPTERFIEEIKRFPYLSPKNIHTIHHAWQIKKHSAFACIIVLHTVDI